MRFLNFYFGRGGEIRTHGLLYPNVLKPPKTAYSRPQNRAKITLS